MTMVISISCDDCGRDEENSTSYESGANEIDGVLEAGWTHEGGADYCPECSQKRKEDGQ